MVKNLFVLIALSFSFILAACTSNSPPNTTQRSTQIQTASPELTTNDLSPTPTPFQEMTIPYLRTKTFTSQLAELTRYQDHTNYTSYLTSYTSENDARINGLLTIPNGNPPTNGWPAIVFVHGYIPPTLYQTTTRYLDHISFLARNGFVVFKIDLRGHGNSEGEAGGGYYSDDYIQDTLYARAALQNSEFVNPAVIGLWGHSMAGNVTLRALVAKPEIPAIVIWAGAVYTYSDMQTYGIDDNSYRPPASTSPSRRRREELFQAYGTFDPKHPFWQQVAPTNYLDNLNSAIQLHHAQNDDVVSIEYSRNLAQILKNQNVEHQLYEYPSGGHNITGNNFTIAMQRTVEFFNWHLN